jgi:hypothetical protein
MEDDLVMNMLPLPRHFDGVEWNTVIRPSRKCIPRYLREDLPALKHLYIKDKFKEIGKFNCPKLEYFDAMIRQKKAARLRKGAAGEQKQVSYNQLKEELQYALIIADQHSNIVGNLLKKAKTCHKAVAKTSSGKAFKRKLSLLKDSGNYFDNTVSLVFQEFKKQFVDSQKATEPLDTTQVAKKLNSIKLLKYQ